MRDDYTNDDDLSFKKICYLRSSFSKISNWKAEVLNFFTEIACFSSQAGYLMCLNFACSIASF